MIDPAHRLERPGIPLRRRRQIYRDARLTLQHPELTHNGSRTEDPPPALEAGRKIGDLENGTVTGLDLCTDDRRVPVVALLVVDRVFHAHIEPAIPVQKRVEHGLAIEPWQAEPTVIAPGVDQARRRAIADDGKVKRSRCHANLER